MPNIDITKAQSALISLLGHTLFSAPLDVDPSVDWSEVVEESVSHAVTLIAFNGRRSLEMDTQSSELLQTYFSRYTYANLNCFSGHKYLHDLMTKNNVPYCIIKGVASARFYENPLIRSMGDVDFYVAPEYVEKAKNALIADGFVIKDKNHSYHIELEKGAMQFELHFAPISAPQNEIGEIYKEYWSDICEGSALVRDFYSEYVLPSDFHHGFILLTHFCTHMISSGVGLRHLCDWAMFVNSLSEEDFVAMFEAKLKRVGLWKLAQTISLVSVKHLGMPHKDWMGDDYGTADALIIDIMRSGNFGRRDMNRYYEDLFISDYRKTKMSRSRFALAFRSINSYVKDRWSAVEKCPLLYPFGWIYFGCRFLILKITGRSRVNIADSFSQSGKRMKLYSDLELFKLDDQK